MVRATSTHRCADRIAAFHVGYFDASGHQRWRNDPNIFVYFRRTKQVYIRVQVRQGCSRANSYNFDTPAHKSNLLLRRATRVIAC